MYFKDIKIILGIILGIFGISHAETPVIVERNCTHVTFAIETQSRNEGFFYMFEDGIPTAYLGHCYFDKGKIVLEKEEGNKYFDYTSLRTDPTSPRKGSKYTVFITFRFPDDVFSYQFGMDGYEASIGGERSTLKIGKSRCLHRPGVIGCHPYCTCGTVMQFECQDGQITYSANCTDSKSLTSNSASVASSDKCLGFTDPALSSTSSPDFEDGSPAQSSAGATAGAILSVLAIAAGVVALFIYKKKSKETTNLSDAIDE